MTLNNLDIFKDLWNMIDSKAIKSPLIGYILLVIIALPIEMIVLPYLIVSKLSRITTDTYNKKHASYLVACFIGIFILLKILSYFRYKLGTKIQYRMYTDAKKHILVDIMNIYKKVQKELPLGRFINHMDNVPFIIEQVVYKGITYLIPEFICLISMVVFLFYVDFSLGCIGLAFIILYLVSIFINIKDPQLKAKREAAYRAIHNQGVMNTLDNILYILVADSFNFETQQFDKNNKKHLDHLDDCEVSNRHFFKKLDIGTVVFLGMLSLRLIQLINRHHRDSDKLIKYTSVFVVILFFLDKLHDFKYMFAEICTYLHKSKVFLEDLEELKSSDTNDTNPISDYSIGENTIEEEHSRDIVIKDLSYSYPKSHFPVFQNKSFVFRQHSITAIQGPSGCGKSTLAKIILGLINPDQGEIYLNGIPCSQANMWRQTQIGYIPQNVKLFESSILDNIRYTCRDLTRDYIDNWIQQAELDSILKRDPNDMDYLDRPVGISGSELSGGQKQLVIILRTFIANSCLDNKKSVFILDEPTSALDPRTTQHILQFLRKMSRQYTILVITHDERLADQCEYKYKL